MSVALTEEQEMLRASARDFLEKECPEGFVQDLEARGTACSPELWHKIAELGWLGLIFPAQFGGSGMGFVDLAVLSEELGRATFPGPYLATVVLGGLSVLEAGDEEQKSAIIPALIEGRVIFAVALDEPSPMPQPPSNAADRVTVQAIPGGDGFVLNGRALLVPDAATATMLLVPAKLSGYAGPGDGITVFLVDAGMSGVMVTPLAGPGGEDACEAVLESVRVSDRSIIGRVGWVWEVLNRSMRIRDVMQSAYMLGAGEKLFQATNDDYETRIKADERASDLHVVKFLGNLRQDLDRCRLVTYDAANRLATGDAVLAEWKLADAWKRRVT